MKANNDNMASCSNKSADKQAASQVIGGEGSEERNVPGGKKRPVDSNDEHQDSKSDTPTPAKRREYETTPSVGASTSFSGEKGRAPLESTDSTTYKIVDSDAEVEPALAELRKRDTTAPFLAVDCEGETLSRRGKLSIVSVATESRIYLFDIKALGAEVFDRGLRDLLQDPSIEKLMFDCRQDSDCLWHLFNVKLANVLDLQLLQVIHREDHQEMYTFRNSPIMLRSYLKCLQFYVRDREIINAKMEGNQLMARDPGIWMKRPLQEKLPEYAAADIRGFFPLYEALKAAIDNDNNKVRLRAASENYLDAYRARQVRMYDKYELNGFVPWRVLPESRDAAPYLREVLCTGCKLRFPRSDFVRHQLQRGMQKCPVCRKIDSK